jgi:hypothetical protein
MWPFTTSRSAVRLERQSNKFDRKHLGTLVGPKVPIHRIPFDCMLADQESTDDSDPTSMYPAAMTLARLALVRSQYRNVQVDPTPQDEPESTSMRPPFAQFPVKQPSLVWT